MLDGPSPVEDRRETLADVARLNWLFGGCALSLVHVKRLSSTRPPNRRLTILDVGTGSSDLPRALVRWARRVGRPIRVFALDRDPDTVLVARELNSRYPEITLLQGDALHLPVRAAAVDVVVSALTIHHFDPRAATRVLAEMKRAAAVGLLVNDLDRRWTAWTLVWLATRILTRNRMSRHDGPLSVRRAYLAGELRALCAEAGLRDARIIRYPLLLRQCIVHEIRVATALGVDTRVACP